MARWYIPGIVLACLAALGCGGGKRPPHLPPDAGVRTALALAIGLLEAMDYTGFVERFVPTAELEAERQAGRPLDDIAGVVLPEPDRLLVRLRRVRGRPPAFHDGGATAVFEAAGPTGTARVVFRRIDGRWYLEPAGG